MELLNFAEVLFVGVRLEIEQPNLVSSLAHRLRHELEPERLEPQENPGVHQPARMNS
jgi:hypothetical protein